MNGFAPTPEQIEVLRKSASDESALVVAGPGTGKTRTAIEMARQKIALLPKDRDQVVLFLSFSRAAIHRLCDAARIQFAREERLRVKFMTYHSCAAELLHNYGRYVGLPNKIRIMDTLEERLLAIERGWLPAREDYQANLLATAKHEGSLAFDTIIPLATSLLRNSRTLREIVVRRYPLIIVDEFQDTSQQQWDFLKLLAETNQIVAFGDPNQIIYSSLHKATAQRIGEFKQWKGIAESRFSAKNFRCGDAEILVFAESLLAGEPYVVAARSGPRVVEIAYRNQLRTALAIIWKEVQKDLSSGLSLGFLAPSNGLAESIAVDLRNPPQSAKVPIRLRATLPRDEAADDAVLLALTALRDYSVFGDAGNRHKAAVAISAMDWLWNSRRKVPLQVPRIEKILISAVEKADSPLGLLILKLKNASDLNPLIRPFVQIMGEAKDLSASCNRILARDQICTERIPACQLELPMFEDIRSNRQPKGLYGYTAPKGDIHVLNYHKAKGREFDAVVMIVDPRGESTRTALDELRRLYYVTATRAKQRLYVLFYRGQLGRILGPVLRPTNRG